MEKSIDDLDLFHFGQSEVYSQRIFFKSIESSVNSNFLNTNDPHNNKISKADTQWHFLMSFNFFTLVSFFASNRNF
jgi:hypothetical protein